MPYGTQCSADLCRASVLIRYTGYLTPAYLGVAQVNQSTGSLSASINAATTRSRGTL